MPGSRASQIWDPELKKATEVVSEGFGGSVSCLAGEGSGGKGPMLTSLLPLWVKWLGTQ